MELPLKGLLRVRHSSSWRSVRLCYDCLSNAVMPPPENDDTEED